ncbi:hypothetical protein K1719_024499 [Acacia pycnantha]|nr:hypothetical protein K1719_024499 [Acacia pycnantha]
MVSMSLSEEGSTERRDGEDERYESSSFFDQTTQPGNSMACGNQTSRDNTTFDSTVQQVLINLKRATPRITGLFAATKAQVPNKGPTSYAIAQCVGTITQSGCLDCLTVGYNNLKTCLPTLEGRPFDAGFFMRYSTIPFFPDNRPLISHPS